MNGIRSLSQRIWLYTLSWSSESSTSAWTPTIWESQAINWFSWRGHVSIWHPSCGYGRRGRCNRDKRIRVPARLLERVVFLHRGSRSPRGAPEFRLFGLFRERARRRQAEDLHILGGQPCVRHYDRSSAASETTVGSCPVAAPSAWASAAELH